MNLGINLEPALSSLRKGEAVVFPTDTIYGLGVSVCHVQTPEALYAIKGREQNKPIAWLVGDVDALLVYGQDVPEYALNIARNFWPGALTLIVNASEKVPSEFASAQGTIGLRMPNNKTALELIRQLGCPLATTSANPSGMPAPQSFAEIDSGFLALVPFAIDDEEVKSGVASTIVDCTGEKPFIVRQGALSLNEMCPDL